MSSDMTPGYLQGAGRGGMSKVPARRPASVKSDSSGTTHTSDLSATSAATNTKKQKSNGLSDSETKELLGLTMKYRKDEDSLTNAESRKMLHLTQKQDGTVPGGAKKARRKRWQFPKDQKLKQDLANANALYFADVLLALQKSMSHEVFLSEKLKNDNWLASQKADAFAASAQRQYPDDPAKDASKEVTDYKRARGVVNRLYKKVWNDTENEQGESDLKFHIRTVYSKYNDKGKFLEAPKFIALKPLLEEFYSAMKRAWTTATSDAEQSKKDRIAALKAKRTDMAGWRKIVGLKGRPRQMRQGLAFETGMPSLYEQDSYDDDY